MSEVRIPEGVIIAVIGRPPELFLRPAHRRRPVQLVGEAPLSAVDVWAGHWHAARVGAAGSLSPR
jgi:hypothetical protein